MTISGAHRYALFYEDERLKMANMTKDEFIKKYGSVSVKFSGYAKYKFLFTADLPDGRRLLVWIGGTREDAYEIEVNNDDIFKVKELDPFPNNASVYKDGLEVDWYCD